jgi:hypothetical protein
MQAQEELTDTQAARKEQRNRRSNLAPARKRAVKVLLSEEEYAVLSQAAGRERLALGLRPATAQPYRPRRSGPSSVGGRFGRVSRGTELIILELVSVAVGAGDQLNPNRAADGPVQRR